MAHKIISHDLGVEYGRSYDVDLRSMDRPLPSSLQHKQLGAGHIIKRWAEMLVALFALIITAPLIAIFSFFIKRDGGPAIYRQQRIGLNGKPITILKLRTMEVGAEELIVRDEHLREQYIAQFKLKDDPRVTMLGKFLRITCIDELPQLISVLRGEMSLVGPRPVLYEETLMYGESRELILSAKPGMTGWWQVNRKDDMDYASRIQMEEWYVSHWSLGLDCKILAQTLPYIAKMIIKHLAKIHKQT